MFKKIVLFTALATQFIFAAGVSPIAKVDMQAEVYVSDKGENVGGITMVFTDEEGKQVYTDRQLGGETGTNWVAIYKQGTSNDWDNVIEWAWTKDLAGSSACKDAVPYVDGEVAKVSRIQLEEPIHKCFKTSIINTQPDDYEVRFFRDNSYDVTSSIAFKIVNHNAEEKPVLELGRQGDRHIIFKATKKGKSWVGIYGKGASNDWINVQAWAWVEQGGIVHMDVSNVDNGEWEARLFYNNSYDIEKRIEVVINAENKKGFKISDRDASTITFLSGKKGEAWIGIYKGNDAVAWENVQAWAWVSSPTSIDISGLEKGNYVARLFYNNSYDVEERVDFYIDNQNYDKLFTHASYSYDGWGPARSGLCIDFNPYKNFQDNDWMAVFSHGAEKKAENIIAWDYLYKGKNYGNWKSLCMGYPDVDDGEYDVVIFSKDTYEVKETAPLTVELNEYARQNR